MNKKEKLPKIGYFLLGAIIVLVIVSVVITQRLLTAEYPTHSDVFFMGVECGVLVVVLLGCIFWICLLLYRLVDKRDAHVRMRQEITGVKRVETILSTKQHSVSLLKFIKDIIRILAS